ncbi:RNA-directed DNA polymerase, eukaryota, reverse transcriptase zinc-binding domain protein [Tanacetum coccineum]
MSQPTRTPNDSLDRVRQVWNSWIPRKVNVGVWRAALNRLATRDNLIRRRIVIASGSCPLCGVDDKDMHHILISCSRVLPLWRKVWSWWNLDSSVSFPSFDIWDVACGNFPVIGNAPLAKVLHGVFQITVWVLWNWRNRVVNAQLDLINKLKEEDVFPSIQRVYLLWISARISATKMAN